LKLEFDAVRTYIDRYNEEITKEKAKVEAAAGSDDLDLVTAVAAAVEEWYKARVTEKKEEQVWREKDYKSARANRDQTIGRNSERNKIQRLQN
jgi:hypothetical protein